MNVCTPSIQIFVFGLFVMCVVPINASHQSTLYLQYLKATVRDTTVHMKETITLEFLYLMTNFAL